MFPGLPTLLEAAAVAVPVDPGQTVALLQSTALTAEHIAALQRVVNGFSTVLEAIQTHATFTGAIQ